jgi:hypothetical protein
MTAAFAVILAAAAPLAYGQTTTTTVPPAASTVRTTGVTANHIMAGQIRATAMNGATVYDVQEKKLDVGAFLGMGGKFVAVGMNDIKASFDTNNKPKFAVDMTKDQLKSAQAYDLDEKKAGTGSSTPPAPRPDDRTR